ncbi:unnamed protein product [Ambrosiozyma monospora]|uniref:Unnamed protein product n=1 Tax=Ambrosiozyma monospora TaxID=43982 RepID=A0ACB5U362_AMBMO|nr:unnamed protein product [Ambrosiozyma monospora]
MCTDIILIEESIYEKAVETIVQIAKGMASDKDYAIPQRSVAQTTKTAHLVEDALAKGAKLLFGSAKDTLPKVLVNVDESMDISHEEIFGPVVALQKFTTDEEVIEAVNSLDYGLKTSIWTSNHLNFYKMAKEIDSGGVHLNGPSVFDEFHLPHGGFNKSGYGKFNSFWGVDEFQHDKLITFTE